MTGGELLPATAWEQAAIIGIFIVFAIFVFGWLAKSRKEDRQFQAEESNKWQTFIGSLDDKWRAFNKEQREENNCAMADVNASLSNLTNVTGDLARSVEEMRVDIKEHDKQAKEILDLVKKPAAKPRAKRSDPAAE
ncbi:MAG: hypothetical protein GX457_13715 [Thermotogaceae bacterium]|nr:hypothetical protein [Thermotogaceae bacterium]